METKVESLQDNQVRLTATIDAKDIDNRIKNTYKDFASKYNFPGFRRGKAPRPVIDNALGSDAVCATVTEDLVREIYPLAVDESGIYPISQPSFENRSVLVEAGKAFSFSATLTAKPDLELESYDPVEIELPGENVTAEETQAQIDSLCEHYFTFEDAAASTVIEEFGTADLEMKAFDEKGEALASITSESRLYTLGSGFYPVEFDAELLGLKKGQKKSFDLEFKGLYTAGLASLAVADQVEKAHFDIEVKAVKKKVFPEVTDEWVSETLGLEGLEDLKTRITESLTQSKLEVLPRIKEGESLHALAERLKGDVPKPMIEAAEADLLKNFFQQLQAQGMSLDVYLAQQGITIDQFKEDAGQQALELTKQNLALDAWAREKDMIATEEDLKEEFANSGSDDPEALEAQWRKDGQLHTLRQGILRMRATQELVDTAIVTEFDPKKTKKKVVPKKTDSKAAGAKATPKKTTAKKASVADSATEGGVAVEEKLTDRSSDGNKVSTHKPTDDK